MADRRGAVARRAAWSASSQAISSVSNFLLTISVLAAADPAEFATFSLCITTYLLVSQLARSLSSVPLMILYSTDEESSSGSDLNAAVGVSVMVGLAAAVILAGVASVAGRHMEQFLIVAAALPLLLFQDAIRHVAFARLRPQIAAFNDGVRLALQVGSSLVALAMGWATVPVLLALWASSGVVAGLTTGVRLGVAPTASGSARWLRRHRSLCEKLVLEFLVNSGSFYLLLYGLALLGGIGELGRLRAAQTLIGPVIVVLLAGNALGIPESARVRDDGKRLRRLGSILSGGLAAAAGLWGAAAYGLLPFFGPRFFPTTWEGARPLLPMLTVFAAAVGVSIGASSVLRALGDNAWIVRARTGAGAVSLLFGLPLSRFAGAQGALNALAGAEILFAAAACLRLARSAGPRTKPSEDPQVFVPM
jgi:O-antigen/teichoic acid export membrane protein